MTPRELFQMEKENEILELIYDHDDLPTSDLQGIVTAIVMRCMNYKEP